MKTYDVHLPVYVTIEAETPEEAVEQAINWFHDAVSPPVFALLSDVQTEDAYEVDAESSSPHEVK